MLGFGYIVLSCLLWALDSLIRYPLIQNGVSAASIVFYEHLILSTLFIVVFFKSIKKVWNAKTSHYFYFFIVGGVGSALATMAFTRAFVFLNPSLVILLQKFQPVVAISLAHMVLKEKIRPAFIFWASICLVGALMVSYEDFSHLFSSQKVLSTSVFHEKALLGYFLVAISIIGWGAATVFGKKLSVEGYSNEEIMAGRFLMGLLFLAPFAYNEPQTFHHSIETYGKITLMVLVSGMLAMFIYYKGLKLISARATSLGEMFFPFMAIIVNWLFLEALLTPIQLAGGGVLLLGSMVIQWKKY